MESAYAAVVLRYCVRAWFLVRWLYHDAQSVAVNLAKMPSEWLTAPGVKGALMLQQLRVSPKEVRMDGCPYCGQPSAGFSRWCLKHVIYNREANRQLGAKKFNCKSRRASGEVITIEPTLANRYQVQRIEAGLCRQCSKPKEGESSRCSKCLAKQRAYNRERRIKARLKARHKVKSTKRRPA